MKEQTKEKILSASKTLLTIIGVAGFVFVAVAAGNAVQLFEIYFHNEKIKAQNI